MSVWWTEKPTSIAFPKARAALPSDSGCTLRASMTPHREKASLYVDGKLIGDDTQAGEMRLDPESLSRPMIIGAELVSADVNDVQNVFDGYIDDVRVYDRALSAEEIGKLAAEAEGKRAAR
jgi:Concanavalin A-like lectin/glucanases superfamily